MTTQFYTNDNRSTVDANYVNSSAYTNLLPDVDNTYNIGSSVKRWLNAFVGGVLSITSSSNQIILGSGANTTTFNVATSGSKTISFPSTSLTVAGRDVANTFSAANTFNNNTTFKTGITFDNTTNSCTLLLPIGGTSTQYNIPADQSSGTELAHTTASQTLTNKTVSAATFTGISSFTNTTDALNATSGSVVFSGGIAVAKRITLGGSILFQPNGSGFITTINLVLPTANRTFTLPDLTDSTFCMIGGAQTLSNKTISSGTFTGTSSFTDTTDATSSSSAPVVLSGGLGVAKKLFVSGATTLSNTATISGGLTVSSGGATITGNSGFNNNLTVNGVLAVSNITLTTNDINITSSFKVAITAGSSIRLIAPTVIETASNQLALGPVAGFNTTITAPLPAANRVYSIPDCGANSSFAMLDGNQTFNNTKTFTNAIVANGFTQSGTKSTSGAGASQTLNSPCGVITFTGLNITTTNSTVGVGNVLTITCSACTTTSVLVASLIGYGNANPQSMLYIVSTAVNNGSFTITFGNCTTTAPGGSVNLTISYVLH